MTDPEPLRAALCVGQWLPASETFIYDQLLHRRVTSQPEAVCVLAAFV